METAVNPMSNDDDTVTIATFDEYTKAQELLCTAYRQSLTDSINGMEKSIKFAVYLSATILGLAITLIQLYLNVL